MSYAAEGELAAGGVGAVQPERAVPGGGWRPGHALRLLENGEEFFPRLFGAIGQARTEVLIETFILFEDSVGHALRQRLIDAAARGVRVELTMDGYGCADLTAQFVEPMLAAGVRLRLFDPQPRFLGLRTNLFRRLHRKLAVIDRGVGFIGGINFGEDHLCGRGPHAKQDFAVEVQGPVVEDLRALMLEGAPRRLRSWWLRRTPPPDARGGAWVKLVTRDNLGHREDIEQAYREAIGQARHRILIANAYFFPGYRFVRALKSAAQRGVAVHLILQGNPDKPLVRWASTTLYDYLLRAGVHIYEFCERPMHSKVAVVDEDWATVGSSNLDPLSLFLNLEANLVVRDAAFAAELGARLERQMREGCVALPPEQASARPLWRQALSWLVFHLLRRFPAWAGWLPAHKPPQALMAEVSSRRRALKDLS